MPIRGYRGRGGRLAVAGLLAISVGAAVVHAAIGDLDTSFAGSGVVVTQLGQGSTPQSVAYDVKLQPDGKIVVAGAASDSAGNSAVAVARYLSSGAFDPTFGSGGTRATVVQLGSGSSPQSFGAFGGRLALQSDGRIVACGVGTDGNGTESLLVARFTAAGAVDPSFGIGGRVLVQLGDSGSPFSSLAGCTVQPDGKIVGVGVKTDSGGSDIGIVVRLNPDGGWDPSFGSEGVFAQQLGLGPTPESGATDVVVQADGRIVFSLAASDNGGHSAMAIGRLTPTGSLDASFGSSGVTVTTLQGPSPFVFPDLRLGPQPTAKFVVGGSGSDAMGHPAFVMARYTSGGALDPTFGSGGQVVSQLSAASPPSSGALGLVVQPNGKPILVGFAADASGDSPMALARYTVDGLLDPTFGSGGIVTQQLGSGSSALTTPHGGVFTPSGRLIVVGEVSAAGPSSWFVSSFIADQPPTATFTFAPAAPVVGDTITLDASGSHDDGVITRIAWDLNGDGTAGDASGPVTTTSFTTGGTHHVSVVVTDDDGLQATAAADIPVGCGTAESFVSVACRLADLIAQVDAGVPAGKVHDKLRAALASAEMHVATAAGLAPGNARKKEIRKAVTAFGHFVSVAQRGKRVIPKAVRDALLGSARALKPAIKKLGTT